MILRAGAIGAIAVAITACGDPGNDFRLPSRITLEDVVSDFTDAFDSSAVAEEASSAPVQRAQPQPGTRIPGAGARTSLVAPPRSRIRVVLAVPEDAVLHVSLGVEGAKKRDPRLGGIRFSVTVGGQLPWGSHPMAHAWTS